MCMLCGETRPQGIREARALAADLRRMAALQEEMASGRLNPHGPNTGLTALAASVIRQLVAEYI